MPTDVGRLLRRASLPLTARPKRLAAAAVFPLPFVAVEPLASSSRQVVRKRLARIWCNIWVAFLNVAYGGLGQPHFCALVASVAQQRVLTSLEERARDFVSEVAPETLCAVESVREFMRLSLDDYDAGVVVERLGIRAGVPPLAARVDTAAVLADEFPLLSALAADPDNLLKDPLTFADDRPRVFTHLDPSYPALVRLGVASGLF